MKMNSSMMMFYIMLLMSTIVVMSSSNWFTMWMGLEINMMMFIPIMNNSNKMVNSNKLMIYFLIQSLGSILYLLMIMLQYMSMYYIMMNNNFMIIIIIVSLLMKMGAAPFHFWLPEVINQLSWMNCFILMTWQKLAPMMMISYFLPYYKYMMLIVMINAIVGAIGGLNQTSIRKIMAYSSINHMSWLFGSMKLENEMWMIYFIVYSIMIMLITFMMNMTSTFYINQLMINFNMFGKMVFMMLMMSLGGLPPFIGFFTKWIIIQSMMMNNLYFTLMVMLLSTLITLFYYLQMCSMMMLNSPHNLKNISMKYNNMMKYMMFINMFLPIMLIIPY